MTGVLKVDDIQDAGANSIVSSNGSGTLTFGNFTAATITASTALVPDASDGAALGTTALEWSDLFLADGAIINFGDDQEVTLTHTADTGITLNSTNKLMFNDASQFIQGASATVLDIAATDEIELTATLIDVVGNLAGSGTGTFGGILKTDDATDATSTTDGSLQTDGGLSVAKDTIIGNDLKLLSDSAVLVFGAGSDATLTHTNDTGLTLNSTNKLMFNDATQFIQGSSGTVLSIGATDEIDLTATAVDLNGTLDVSGATLMTTLGVITAKDLGIGIHIREADSGASVAGAGDLLVIENSADAGMSILSGTSGLGKINFGDSGDNDIGFIKYDHSENAFTFTANAQAAPNLELLNAYSAVVVGQTGGFSQTAEGVKLATNENFMTVDSSGVLNLNREGTDGLIMSFFADNTSEGNITSSGSTIQFNTFCGAHWGRLADNSQPTILRGTVIETISTMIDWYRVKFTIPEKRNDEGVVIRERDESAYEEIELPDGKSVGDAIKYTHNGDECDGVIELQPNEQLPMTKVSDTEDSKAVYGVFSRWDNEPDDGVNDMNVAALGAFIIRVHKDETVSIGDLLSSKGDGTAKVQADDIMRSKTIAKVTSTNKTYTYDDGSYCVPCTLHCG